jgi:hypothetical protein
MGRSLHYCPKQRAKSKRTKALSRASEVKGKGFSAGKPAISRPALDAPTIKEREAIGIAKGTRGNLRGVKPGKRRGKGGGKGTLAGGAVISPPAKDAPTIKELGVPGHKRPRGVSARAFAGPGMVIPAPRGACQLPHPCVCQSAKRWSRQCQAEIGRDNYPPCSSCDSAGPIL